MQAAFPTPVPRHRPLANGVFDALSAAILHGDLCPGDALPAEPRLAAQLGVKRGVLREGIKLLEQAGLVEPRQGGGTFVCDYRQRAGLDLLPALLLRPGGGFDPAVVRSVMEMRSAIAPDVARLAARRRDAAHVARLRECVLALSEGEGPERDAAPFWDALVDASDNVAYRLAYNAVLSAAALGGARLTQLLAVELEPLSDYASLVAAVDEQDAAGAAALALRIVRRGQDAVARSLAGTAGTAGMAGTSGTSGAAGPGGTA